MEACYSELVLGVEYYNYYYDAIVLEFQEIAIVLGALTSSNIF